MGKYFRLNLHLNKVVIALEPATLVTPRVSPELLYFDFFVPVIVHGVIAMFPMI